MKSWRTILGSIVAAALISALPGAAQNAAGDAAQPPSISASAHIDGYIQALRSDLGKDKVQIVAETMRFSEAEAAAFWPIYRNYQAEVSQLNDQGIALLKDYAEHFSNMPAATAKQLAERSFALEQQKTDLKRKYFKLFEKAMPANRVAKFFQVDHRLDLLVGLQIASQVPLME